MAAYGLEKEMIPDLLTSVHQLFGRPGPYAVACEVPDGSRVVDMMYAAFGEHPSGLDEATSLGRALSRLSLAQMMVLAQLWRHRKLSVRRLSEMMFIPEDVLLRQYLRPMKRLGLTEQVTRSSWQVADWGVWKPEALVAIEAKLTDWREALGQAVDNRKRADYSYIALPAAHLSERHPLWSDARRAGVGVIHLDPTRGAQIVLRARRTLAAETTSRWHVSLRLLADLLADSGRWQTVLQPEA